MGGLLIGEIRWIKTPDGWHGPPYFVEWVARGNWLVTRLHHDGLVSVIHSAGSATVAKILAADDLRSRMRIRRLAIRCLLVLVALVVFTRAEAQSEMWVAPGVLVVIVLVGRAASAGIDWFMGRSWEHLGETFQ